ncbi:MAG: hypothetical protein QNJ94_03565 [Alphaproteobacteria bacterium]|nr:hypothetical protein [Alphaproteobacteria bacterium]
MAAGLLLCVVGLAACAEAPMETKWRQKGVSGEQRQRDTSYCDGAAELAKSYGLSRGGASELDQRAAFEDCMRDRGYRARSVRAKKPKLPSPRRPRRR